VSVAFSTSVLMVPLIPMAVRGGHARRIPHHLQS
jgi:hypothetical protein